MPRSRTLVVLVALFVAALVGCSNKKSPTNLPPGDQLVKESATAMRAAQNAHVTIEADTIIADVPLKRADGVVTREGEAEGTIQLEQLGTLVEFSFVIVGQTLHLKGPTGGWQALPLSLATNIYDPSAILDPDRGIAKILETATEAKTEAREKVDGRDAYKVSAKLDNTAVDSLVPGVGAGVTGQFWIDAENKQLRKAVLSVPGQSGSPNGTVNVTVADIDAQVSISAP